MSFSAEMKDFLGGFQTVESVFARQKQMQIAQQRANDLAAYHAQLGGWADAKTAKIQGTAGGGAGGSRGRGRGGVSSETAAMNAAAGLATGKGNGKAPAADAATDPRSDLALKIAVDATDPSNATDNADGTDSADNPSVQQTNAGGGPIQKFAGGGAPTPISAIPTGQLMQPPTPAPAAASPTPMSAPAPTPAPTPAPVLPAPVLPAPNPPMQAIPSQPPAMAPNASIQNGAPPAAPQPVPAPPAIHPTTIKLISDKATQAIVAAAPLVFDPKSKAAGDDGKPGMSPQELDAAVNATDPNGEMPAFLKQTAFLAKAYDHFNALGNHKAAAGIAAEVLKSNLYATQTLGTLAVHAFVNGDIPNACRIINDACNRFPSGHDISIRPDPKLGATYTVADDSGKIVEQGVASTAKIYEMAKGISDGSLYLQQMARTVQDYGPKQAGAIPAGGSSGQAGVKQPDWTPQKGGKPRQPGGSGGDTTTPSVDYTPVIKPLTDPVTGVTRSPNGSPPVAPGTPPAQAIPTATHPDPSIGHAPPASMSMITPEQAAHVKDVLAKGADPKAVQQYLLAQGVSTQGM